MSTHIIPFSIQKRKVTLNYLKSASMGFSQGTRERVRNSRGRRAISVRATEILLYCNVCEALICKLAYLFIVFGEHGRYIGNINHLW